LRAWVRGLYSQASSLLAGPYYGAAVVQEARPIGSRAVLNVLATLMDAYMPQLTGDRWRIRCDPKMAGLTGDAILRGHRLTQIADEIRVAQTDRRVVMDSALCGEGVYRIGLREGADWIRVDGELHDSGQPFVARVPPGQFTRDPLSRHWHDDRFRGDRFTCDRQWLLEMGIGDPDKVRSLPSIADQSVQRDMTSPEAQIGLAGDDLLSDDLIQLWYLEVWDGARRLEMVVPDLDGYDGWIIEPREYMGYEAGPYECLHLYDHPDRPTGISLAARLIDLHLAIKDVSERLVDHILRTRRNMVYRTETGRETAMAIQEALDDQPIPGDPESVREVVSGGLIDQFARGLDVLLRLADSAGASLRQAAGREGVANTATEAHMIAGKAQNVMDMVRSPVTEARRRIVQRLSWYEDTAPVRQQVYGMQVIPGVLTNVVYDPATREGDFSDFSYDCRVESASGMDAPTKIARLSQVVQVLPPWVQLVAGLGGDIAAALRLFASEFPEIDECFPTPQGMQAAQAMAQMAGPPPQAAGVRRVGTGGDRVRDGVAQMASDAAPAPVT